MPELEPQIRDSMSTPLTINPPKVLILDDGPSINDTPIK